MLADRGLVPLQSVLCTDELKRRPLRQPDRTKESRALVALVRALVDAPGTLLQALADAVLEVLDCGSAGLSLLSKDEESFHWTAIAGAWAPHRGGSTPRDFGPCGDVLDGNAPLLFSHWERRYPYLQHATPLAEECLLVPFHVHGRAVGTIWAMAHDAQRRFDAEDLRLLGTLGRFASAAYQALATRELQDSRRAALNLMEDALLARQEMAALTAASLESERRFREMIDALPAAVYTTDASGLLTHYNPAAAEFAGRTPQLGEDRWCVCWKLYRPDGTPLPHELCPMATTLAQGRDVRGEQIIAERPDGTRRWFATYPTPLRDADGQIAGGINMLVDITASKKAEAALLESDRRKNDFLAMLAHELRNPLAPIRNSLAILRGAGAAALPNTERSVQSALQMMERQVGQMVRLVDDLLDMSRISRGTIELRRAAVDVVSVVQQVAEGARPFCESSGHQLSVSLPGEAVLLDADPTRLAQIVGNLVNNACKFTDRGGRIALSVEMDAATDGAAPQVVIRVCDNGIGIAADQLARIFQMFTQVDASRGRAAGGLGIGLALVKDLVELHGGTVAAHSGGLGKGSEFEVRLPLGAPASEPGTPAPPSATAEAAAKVLEVLVVDDNRDAAESLALVLQLKGHRTHLAHDGLEAVEAVARLRPDVVLLDIGLPKIDGYEAARRIRAQDGDKHLLLVAVSGWGQPDDRRRSAQAGFDAHLVKPVEPEVLLKLMGMSSGSAAGTT